MNFLLLLISIEILGMLLILVLGISFKYKYSLLEFLSFSFFGGLGLISLIQFFFYFLKWPLTLGIILFITGAALALLSILYSKFSDKVISKHIEIGDLKLFEKLIILGLLIQFAWVILHALPVPVRSYDSVATFSLKAKIFYLNQGIPADFFKLDESAVWHIDYPLLLPFFMVWAYHFIGFNDILVVSIMPALYMIFIIFFYALLRKYFNKRYSLVCAFVLAAIPQLARFAMVMYADLVLTAFVTCAFLYFMLYLNEGKEAYLVFSSLLFGLAVWVKNEGLVFLLVFLICLIFAKRRLSSIILPVTVGLLAALPWLIFKSCVEITNSDINLNLLTSERLLKNLKESPALFDRLQMEVFNPKKWNLLWIVSLLTVIFKIKRHLNTKTIFAIYFIFISGALYFLSFILIVSYDMVFVSEKTISRSMIHFSGIFVFLTAYLLWDDFCLLRQERKGSGEN